MTLLRHVREDIEQERRNQEVQLRELRNVAEGSGQGMNHPNTNSMSRLPPGNSNRGNQGSQKR